MGHPMQFILSKKCNEIPVPECLPFTIDISTETFDNLEKIVHDQVRISIVRTIVKHG